MDASVIALVMAVAGAGGTAIKLLWDRVTTAMGVTEKALDKCHEEHQVSTGRFDELNTKFSLLSRDVGKFEGRIETEDRVIALFEKHIITKRDDDNGPHA